MPVNANAAKTLASVELPVFQTALVVKSASAAIRLKVPNVRVVVKVANVVPPAVVKRANALVTSRHEEGPNASNKMEARH